MEEKKWYLAFSDHHEGPFTSDEIQKKIAQGKMENPFVWCEGMADWVKFSDSPVFPKKATPAPPPVPPPMAPPSAAKSPKKVSEEVTITEEVVLERKQDNDISGFIELDPLGAEDRTDRIDVFALKKAKKEAKKIARSASRPDLSDGEETPPRRWGLLAAFAIVFIVLGFYLRYGRIF